MFPFLVDIQSDLLGELNSRVVIPLTKVEAYERKPVRRLMPMMEFEGETYVLLTPDVGAVQPSELGPAAGSLAEHRDAIIAAVDFLVLGFRG